MEKNQFFSFVFSFSHWVPGARTEWVGSLALGAKMAEVASCITALAFVVAAAYLASNRTAPRLWAHVCTLGMACPGRGVREPPKHWSMRVSGALLGVVVVLETVGATGDRSGPAREGLVVEVGVRYQPVEILLPQCLAVVLAIVRNLSLTLVVPVSLHYGGLVGKQLPNLIWELSAQDDGHQRVSLEPLRYVCDGQPRGGVVVDPAPAGGGGGGGGGASSIVTSDISMKSRSSIFFTTRQ